MFAVVPVKSLDSAKQRLATVLPAAMRKQLTVALLSDVLDTLHVHPAVERVLVISADREVAALAREFGADFLDEVKLNCSGLNGTVNAAARRLASEGVSELMVLHGDLPLLNRDEVSRFIATHGAAAEPAVTLTPDGRRDGTNLLAWNPQSPFQAQYGPGSFARHCYQCQRLGITPTVCVLRDAGFDVDLPEDFMRLKMMRGGLGQRMSVLLADDVFAAMAGKRKSAMYRR